jgi:hypothetical protein
VFKADARGGVLGFRFSAPNTQHLMPGIPELCYHRIARRIR